MERDPALSREAECLNGKSGFDGISFGLSELEGLVYLAGDEFEFDRRVSGGGGFFLDK